MERTMTRGRGVGNALLWGASRRKRETMIRKRSLWLSIRSVGFALSDIGA